MHLKLILLLSLLLFIIPKGSAFVPQTTKNVHIELHYALNQGTSVVGTSRSHDILPVSYYMYNDIFTNDEIKIKSQTWNDRVTTYDFNLNHPLYDYINHGGDIHIPFYVEPGDSIIINLTKAGKVLSYKKINNTDIKYTNLLLHDFSNNILYNEIDFDNDKKNARFPEFVRRVLTRMNATVDSINHVADRYSFCDTERSIAINNAKLQYAIWIFEFASFKSMEINTYSSSHNEGWQSIPYQDQTFSDLQNPANYAFLRQLPLNDNTCLASRYFQPFIIAYEHAHMFNYDQYIYYGTSQHDQARMDSVFMSKELAMTGHLRPSLMMEIAMYRKHFEAPQIDDESIKLQEVQVIGHQNDYYKGVTPEDMTNWRLNQKPTLSEQIASPSYWLYERKKYKNRERAKALIKQIEEAEERDKADQAEREAVMKAYEEEMKRQGK